MKHLKLFDTVQSYNTYKSSGQLALPNVSLCEDQQGIFYKKDLLYDAEVEYLESTGIQWIDTLTDGYNPSIITIKFAMSAYINDMQIFGVDQSSFQYLYSDFYSNRIYIGAVDGEYYIGTNFNTNDHIVVRDTVNGVYKLDDNLLPSRNPHNFSLHSNILIGKRYGGQNFRGKIYYFNIIDSNNTLVIDLIPVRVGNVGYMYDKVSGQLFGNSGTGNFILGPDK